MSDRRSTAKRRGRSDLARAFAHSRSSATVHGVEIPYARLGTGPTLVLLHGGLTDGRSWFRQRPLASWLTLLAPDQRGFGRSSGEIRGATVADLADDVRGLLDALGEDSAWVMGFSMGGMIAQQLALAAPHRVLGLILVGTRAGPLSPISRPQHPDPARAHVERVFSPGFLRRHISLVQAYEDVVRDNQLRGWSDIPKVLATTPFLDDVGAITAPTLIVHGRLDAAIPIEEAERLHGAISGSELRIVERAGHTVHIERPRLFNTLVRGFIGLPRDAGERPSEPLSPTRGPTR